MEDVEFNVDDDNVFKLDDGSNENDEITIKKKVPLKKRAAPILKNKVHFAKHNPIMQKPQIYKPPPQPMDTTFETFSNPAKKIQEPAFDDDDDDNDDGDSDESNDNEHENTYYGNQEQEEQPSPGFATIEDEKQDLLYKFHRLESRGIKFSKKFNAYSDIREMRAEYQRAKRDSEVNSSIKFARRVLMASVSGTEFLNKRYDPFGFELNGWSETVMENVNDGDYDQIFERLHDKYSGRVDMPPELELLFSLAGSAAMFHMTSTMFKSIPNLQDIAKQNPDLKNAMKNMADQLMKSQQDINTDDTPNEDTFDNKTGRREMNGPSINLSQFSNFMPPPEMQSNKPNMSLFQKVDSSPSISDDSEVSGLSIKKVSVSEGGTKRGRKPKNSATKDNTIVI
uniref:Uncharacterized protein n=1 Tax=viral metagenome TaxID=1070528 RepID=A0A6C0F5G2_9ZZZZ|tara:strand:+ start:19296 stop:20483 length:1188 start_codon:yes stop_codon:yes gene_type:complete